MGHVRCAAPRRSCARSGRSCSCAISPRGDRASASWNDRSPASARARSRCGCARSRTRASSSATPSPRCRRAWNTRSRTRAGRCCPSSTTCARTASSGSEVKRALASFAGLERYLASARTDTGRTRGRGRGRAALRMLLEDVFEGQTDFQLRPERLRAAIQRLERATGPGAARVTLLATLHGVTIASPELQFARGLTIARAGALDGVPPHLLVPPPGAGGGAADGPHAPLLLVHTAEDDDFDAPVQRGQ